MKSLKKSATSHDCRHDDTQSQWLSSQTAHRPAAIKIVIQSVTIQPNSGSATAAATTAGTTKMPFQALIQRANDSGSFDTSLEYKSLPSNRCQRKVLRGNATNAQTRTKSFHNHTIHGIRYMDELRERLNQTNAIDMAPKKTPFADKKNVIDTSTKTSATTTPKSTCQKLMNSISVTAKRLPTSSTPFRPKRSHQSDLHLQKSSVHVDATEYDDTVTVGDDTLMDVSTTAVESGDEDDTQNRTLIKCFSLTPHSCRRLSSFVTSNRSVTSAPNSPEFERRNTFLSSFRKNRSSIVSPLEESPLRRQKNVKLKNSAKFFNLFRSTPIASKTSATTNSNLSDTCSRLQQLLANAEDLDESELGCVPLTSDAVSAVIDAKTAAWEENFDFSFICEPSHSDVENDFAGDEDDQQSVYMSCESMASDQRARAIPMVKVSSPVPFVRQRNRSTNHTFLSPVRRSVSDSTLHNLVFSVASDGGRNTATTLTDATDMVVSTLTATAVAATNQIQMHAIRVSTR